MMKLSEYNLQLPPNNMTEQSEWNALWIPAWYAGDQSLVVGEQEEYVFHVNYSQWLVQHFFEKSIPTPALIFDNDHYIKRETPLYVFSGRVQSIWNTRFGAVKSLVNKGFDYEMVLESGEQYTINSEEEPGALWDEGEKKWLNHSKEYDWSMLVQFQILDRDPYKIFSDNRNPASFALPPQSDQAASGPLHDAVKQADLDSIRDLLDSGVNVNVRAGNGDTPLFRAVRSGNREIVEILFQRSANPNIQNHSGWSPLHTVAVQGYTELVQLVLDHGAYVDPRTKQGWTPLFLAAGNGHADIAKLLLDAGADVYAEDVEENIPLHNARKNGYQEIVKLLKDAMGLQY